MKDRKGFEAQRGEHRVESIAGRYESAASRLRPEPGGAPVPALAEPEFGRWRLGRRTGATGERHVRLGLGRHGDVPKKKDLGVGPLEVANWKEAYFVDCSHFLPGPSAHLGVLSGYL